MKPIMKHLYRWLHFQSVGYSFKKNIKCVNNMYVYSCENDIL